MKKLLFSVLLMLSSLFTFAQSATFGLRGGVNFAKLDIASKSADITISTGSLTTFSASAFADFKIGSISIQPAISYTGKGGSINDSEGNATDVKLYYAQVPVNIVYHIPVPAIGNIYFGAGPYAAFGIYGIASLSDGTNTEKASIKFGNSEDSDFKSTDFGVNFIAGFQFKQGLLFHINYDLGLSNNIPNNFDGDSSAKHRVLGLSVGYAF